MKDLTKKQKQVLDCIISSIRERGYCPSVRELGRELGLSSPSTVNSHLDRLEELGYIRREASAEDGRCRRIYPTEKAVEVYPRVHRVFEDFTAGILEGLTEEEQAELERLTEILRRNALRLTEPERGGKP